MYLLLFSDIILGGGRLGRLFGLFPCAGLCGMWWERENLTPALKERQELEMRHMNEKEMIQKGNSALIDMRLPGVEGPGEDWVICV